MNRAIEMSTACDLCGETHAEVVARVHDERGGTDYEGTCVRCLGCGLVSTQPAPPAESLGRYYPDGYSLHAESAISDAPAHRIALRRALSARNPVSALGRAAFNLVAFRGLPGGPPGRLLDVGAGVGQFVADMTTIGWDARGVELSPGAVATARGLDRDVREGTIFDASLDGERFDLVSFWHVLEHLPSPVAALERARELLVPGGRVLIAVPNWQSALRPRMASAWWALEVPRHLYHFEPDSLRKVLDRAGFDVDYVRPKVHGRMVASSRVLRDEGGPMLVGTSARLSDWAVAFACAPGKRTDTIWASARAR